MAIKDRIKEARSSKSYTQNQLADLIGVSRAAVSAYEKGIRKPNIDMLVKLSTALDVTLNDLCQDEISSIGEPMQLSDDEIRFIEGYRSLSDSDKEIVDHILAK